MNHRQLFQSLCLTLLPWIASSTCLLAQQRMTPELLWKLGRVGEAQLSPDARGLAMTVTHYDLVENSGKVDLVFQELPQWLGDACDEATEETIAFETPLAKLNRPKILIGSVKGLNSVNWIHRPEGWRILYIAPSKEEKPTPQAWLLDPPAENPSRLRQSLVVSAISKSRPLAIALPIRSTSSWTRR